MQNKLKVPSTWTDRKIAGRDWFSGFLYGNSNLSIRRPEATSLVRMTSFNKTNINELFDKLERLYRRNNFTATDIYNLDETGITSVQRVQSSRQERATPNRARHIKGKRRAGDISRNNMCQWCCTASCLGFSS